MGYGYMQPGVEHVMLSIDQDRDNGGLNASVTYSVKLRFWPRVRYAFMNYLARGGIFKKLLAFGLIRMGAIPPGYIETQVMLYARAYLPDNFKITVTMR